MSQVLLVRHGQASWGAADYDRLSERGEAQSRMLGEALAGRGVVASLVVSGRMLRHRQTLSGVCAGAGWDTASTEDAGWDEFDHGQMLMVHEPPSTPAAELGKAEFQAWFEAATRRWVSGRYDADYDEPFGAFCGRVEDALRRTTATLEPGGTAVVFTSGGPVSWVAAWLLGGGVEAWARLNPVTVNTGVTKLVVGRRGTTLVTFNEHGHLEPDHVTYR